MNKDLIIRCPKCNIEFYIDKIKCGIFRCGIYKKNYKQIPPHSSKDKCQTLVNEGLIIGCGSAFKINKKTLYAELCDYI